MLANESRQATEAKPTEPMNINSQSNATDDPFAGQRQGASNPFTENGAGTKMSPVEPSSPTGANRRQSSDEWDASKTPPSRFQQRKGSIYATPSSRDGGVEKNKDRDAKFHEKIAEKGYGKRRGSKAE